MLFKKTRITIMTPLPPSTTRESVMEILHKHVDMIDLNPLVIERHPITPPDSANGDELLWKWYRIHDGLQTGYVKYDIGFHDLEDGLETTVYAPLGVQTKTKWTIGIETLPRDEEQIAEGAPEEKGPCVKEEVEVRSFILLTWYVKRTLKKAHYKIGRRLVAKAEKLSETRPHESKASGETQQHDQNSFRGKRHQDVNIFSERQQHDENSSHGKRQQDVNTFNERQEHDQNSSRGKRQQDVSRFSERQQQDLNNSYNRLSLADSNTSYDLVALDRPVE